MAWLLIHQLIRLLHFCEPSHEGLGIHIISFPVLSYLLESIDWWMVKLMEYGFDSGIPWNGKQDILIDRFDGRALLDFIRDPSSRHFRALEKSEEEEELEEFVNFERYRDLIKHRRRGFSDEAGLQHVAQELEAKAILPFSFEKSQSSQAAASKGAYSQVGYSYKGDGNEDSEDLNSDDEEEEEDEDEDGKDFSSDDSSDERMENLAKEFGVKRYNWLVYMDKKAKEEEKRQKEIIKGDPSIKKLSRRERRKASQSEREREREAVRSVGRAPYRDPYREQRRSPSYEAYSRGRRSRSRSPSYSKRHARGTHAESNYRSKPKPPRVEYITEFGGSDDTSDLKVSGISPPSSPIRVDIPNRSSGVQILEALHSDPASSLSVEQERSAKNLKPPTSTSSALLKLSKGAPGGAGKTPLTEKKETPQERLKRIMSKQLNKQIRKDTAAETAKKREQERQRQEKLAEVGRYKCRSRSRSLSRSPPRKRHYSRSRSRSPRRRRSRSLSHSSSPSRSPRYRSRSRH
ncbi:CLK4-associating serine/arginine rich protein isoform X2 [Brachypodium distachyon]|uniref:CLK4-associating serine/arginine rich protein isoform X2 n=1 Tax=Brachypodium distachyon TaxID=15368 RepID=UPI00052FDF8E|nr:CLK4-associating serine/arginine rich protein isoform X2 [Brachypodium distachyon]|eukprot:XP_010228531.1 CLK4-associating serine/arginine rich protein isoform X2 [Brachypodium distachyon]